MKKQSNLGFTLGELMITVALVAIIAGLAAPAMSSLIENNRLDSAKNAIVSSLVAARSEAVARNQQAIVCPSSDGSSCAGGSIWENGWLAFVDENSNGSKDAGEPIIDVANEVLNITLRSNNVGSVTYFADGTVSNMENFDLCGTSGVADDGMTLAVSITGRPRVSSGAGACP